VWVAVTKHFKITFDANRSCNSRPKHLVNQTYINTKPTSTKSVFYKKKEPFFKLQQKKLPQYGIQ
jgi:hypothetical protein